MVGKRLLRWMICAALTQGASAAWAVDIIPGQGMPPPAGMNSFMISLGHAQSGDKYVDDRKLGLNTRVNSDTVTLRYTRSFALADNPAAFYIQPAFGRASPSGSLAALDAETGLRDTTAAVAIWPYVDHESRRWFGMAAYLILPTGEYDSRRLINLGQNRSSMALQAAFQTPLGGSLEAMIATDVHWFGENDDYRLTHQKSQQRPLYSQQLTLMYNFDAATMLAASYILQTGAMELLDSVPQNNRSQRNRYQLAAIKRTAVGNFIVQYGQDLSIDQGTKENHQLWLRHQIVWR